MRMAFRISLFALLVMLTPASLMACEPMVALALIFLGPLHLLKISAVLVISIVLAKSLLFAYYERSLSWHKAIVYMCLANLFSTLMGIVASLPFGAPSLISIAVVVAVSILPAKRLKQLYPTLFIAKWSPISIALLVAFALYVTMLLFMASQGAVTIRAYGLFWVLKLGYVYVALLISLFLTVFWEEWVIAALAQRPTVSATLMKSVFHANLIALLLIMAIAAAIILPMRLNSPDFLVQRSSSPSKSNSIVVMP
jgi:hypothetical protein